MRKMREAQVDEFHKKQEIKRKEIKQKQKDPSKETAGTQHLIDAARSTHETSERLLNAANTIGDDRLMQSALVLEETAEIMQSMADRDELKLLDSLIDTDYVVVSTAVQYDLPIEDGFDEVHKSNMTKNSCAAWKTGDRGKGRGYRPPSLWPLLTRRRTLRALSQLSRFISVLSKTCVRVHGTQPQTIEQKEEGER